MAYSFEFNQETSDFHKISVEARPNIPGKRRKVTYTEVGGKDELVSYVKGAYENVTITVKCAYKIEKESWNRKRRRLEQWLSGTGELIFSDDPEVFWKVKEIQISEIKRILKKYGHFDIKFICSPFEYLVEGRNRFALQEVQFNPYGLAKPEYEITGEGTCTILVNGKTVRADVGQNLTINTGLMLAYREDGTIMNTAITGDYRDLYLKPGENSISVSAGFSVAVKPNWRYG